MILTRRLDGGLRRDFYETEALRGGWTVRQLERQIESQFFERTALSRNKVALLQRGMIAKPEDAVTPEQEIKDPFALEFLALKDEYSETDLEDALISPSSRLSSVLMSDSDFRSDAPKLAEPQCKRVADVPFAAVSCFASANLS